MNNILPKFDNLDKIANVLKISCKEAQTRNISCDIFILQVEFITEVLLTVLVCNLRAFPGEI